MQLLYLVLCLLGAALPLSQFAPWLAAHGLAVPLLIAQAFASPVAAFAWLDVLVSALALVAFMLAERRRLKIPVWPPLLALLLVGVSLALPLFLLMRERRLVRAGAAGADTRGG